MESSEIKRLLSKYYDGLTSEEEERTLECFFRSEDVPAELKDEQEFFTRLHSLNATAGVPEGFDRRLGEMIDGLAADVSDRPAAVVPLRRMLRHVAGIAAGVLLVASVGFGLISRADRTGMAGQDDQVVIAQAQQAILDFSLTLNKGLDQMETASLETAAIGEKINKSFVKAKIHIR